MSACHPVKDDTDHPAVMPIHGLKDPHIAVRASAKMTARLHQATSGGKLVIARLDARTGHGIGSALAQRISMSADIYAFLLKAVVMLKRVAKALGNAD